MRIGRTVPPTAAPLGWKDLWHGVGGICAPHRSIRAREEEIRDEFGVRHVFLLSSGKAALTLTLIALKSLSCRREVVIPAYTCFSVPAAVLSAGLQPSPCDIDPATFDFDHTLLEQTLGEYTLCVVAHHLFGIPAAIDRIRALCRRHGVFVVEDAAQAMGVQSDGRNLGTIGDVGIFSLGRGKNITCGSGGIIVTNSPQIAEAIDRLYRQLKSSSAAVDLKDFLTLVFMTLFIRPSLYWIPAALPFLKLGRTIFPKKIQLTRLSGMKAGLLRNWRNRLARSNRARAQATAYFSRRLSLCLPHGPSLPYLRLPIVATTAEERQEICSRSRRLGLGIGVAYPSPVDEIPELQRVSNGKRFPSARRVSTNLLTLPTHPLLSERHKRAIADLCRKVRVPPVDRR